ncbi:hypothetical protein FRC08_012845 [Ceratobasidium sp. 394]|nr:hypothetical protein FRC08_012845 [Ceratobasidium sp. 394]
MICGTSTGGLIAIMLGRLRMSVEQAITAYVQLARDIFSETKLLWKEGTYKASNLESAIKIIVGRYGVPAAEPFRSRERDERDEEVGSDVKMLDNRDDTDRGRVFVCSLMAENASSSTRFRTYSATTNPTANCYIWEAARATTAAPKFFKAAWVLEDSGIKMRYIDGGLRCNNPTHELLDEAANFFPDRLVACILSIGTGRRGKIELPDTGLVPKLQLAKVVKVLQKIALDCEKTHQELSERFYNRPGTYFRFNVDHGMEAVGLAEWERGSGIQADTASYTRESQTTHSIDSAVEAILRRNRDGMMTVGQAAGR